MFQTGELEKQLAVERQEKQTATIKAATSQAQNEVLQVFSSFPHFLSWLHSLFVQLLSYWILLASFFQKYRKEFWS